MDINRFMRESAVGSYAEVSASANGIVLFKTSEELEVFCHLLEDNYPTAGYGTAVSWKQNADGLYEVNWYIGSAD